MENNLSAVVIETDRVSKHFGSNKAVNHVTLSVKKGEIYALIGPNGAGKSTLIKMLVGLYAPTSGKVVIAGYDMHYYPVRAKEKFAYIPDDPSPYDYLTGEEFLELTGNLRGLSEGIIKERVHELSTLFPLGKILHQQMASYSRGNKQKVAFLGALLGKPEILLIDEPIVGLDPQSIEIFGNTLKGFAENGGTIFFTTHTLSFAQQIAQRVGVMKDGEIVKEEKVKSGMSLTHLYTQEVEHHED